MNKNVRNLIIGLGVIAICIAGGIGGYLYQKQYYEKMAIENTRFITLLTNKKIMSNVSIKTILDTSLDATVWTQSKINDNKYLVACKGSFNGTDVLTLFYISNTKNSITSIQIFRNGKLVDSTYAQEKIILHYYDLTGKTITDSSLEKAHEVFKLFSALDKNFNPNNIDKAYLTSYMSNKDTMQKNAAAYLNGLIDGSINISDYKALSNGSTLSQDDINQINNMTEVERREFIDDLTNKLMGMQ